jgi:hypothetical protein
VLTFDHELKFGAPLRRDFELHRLFVFYRLIYKHCLNYRSPFKILARGWCLLGRRSKRLAFVDS